MGGPGSGRWGGFKAGARALVEECKPLDAAKLVRDGSLGPGLHVRGVLRWHRGGRETGSVGYEARTGADGGTVRLFYAVERGGEPAGRREVTIVVERTSRPYPRWWLSCPACGRRCGKLHLPPGREEFRCRRCWGLAYTSSRESRKYDAAFRRLGGAVGMGLGDVKRLMNRWSRRTRREAGRRDGSG